MNYNDTLEQWEKKIWQSMPPPGAGMLLVANPFMLDPNFKRTVILLLDHDAEGSFGLVLNHSLEATLSSLVPTLKDFDSTVFQGGPVELNTLHFIHRAGDVIKKTRKVGEGIYWGGDFEHLLSLANIRQLNAEDFRFFAGYSGWGKGQLEEEQKGRSWLITRAIPQLVFQQPEDAWATVIRHMGGHVSSMLHFPEDPSLN